MGFSECLETNLICTEIISLHLKVPGTDRSHHQLVCIIAFSIDAEYLKDSNVQLLFVNNKWNETQSHLNLSGTLILV